jgi:hypothetical protein
MKGFSLTIAAAIAVVLTVVACSDSTSSTSSTPSAASQELAAAFLSTPAGFSSTDNTFSAGGDAGEPWMPDRSAKDDDGHMMGGGLGPEFFGGVAVGHDFDHGPFGFGYFLYNCTFSSTTGRDVCQPVTRGGLTIKRSFSFQDASGAAQPFPNFQTNTINAVDSVDGTVTRHDGRVTSTVHHSSNRTVSGLASGSTKRTVDGGSKGTEDASGKTPDSVSFTSSRVVADTVKGLVVPLMDNHPTFPIAGTVTRFMQATLTLSGQPPVTKSRMEVITYDGTDTAKVVITKNGTTKNCKMPLPFGKLICS